MSAATDSTDSISTLSPETKQSKQSPHGEGCANCGSTDAWGHSSWCPRCGWYPALNQCVEVDPIEDENGEGEELLQWWEVIPLWGWVLSAGVVGLVVLSIFARVTTSAATGERGTWALIQMGVGFCILSAGQIWAFTFAVLKSSDFAPIDIIFKPFGIWSPSTRELPKSFPRVAMGVWGMSAVMLAVLVIGGVRYSAIFDDWGFEEQAQMNLVQQITNKARQESEGGADSLEGAINDFAGEKIEEEKEEPVPVELIEMDCLIIGYTGNTAEEFSGLVLAALVRNRLRFVGVVYEGIPDEERAELASRMGALKRDRPFVKARVNATWLEPKLMCRVTATELKNGKSLKNAAFKEMLADAQ